ncbi:MAG: PDZ domain-containing protein, partial [Solobacterium sp.]|nr:PDZ domain-containing protein [Solobacterium sp.]
MEFTQGINRDFVGIGVQFTNLENGLQLITRVFRDSPAEKAGVQAGDIIHSVDGVITENKTTDEIKELVQGEEGTVVTIVFQREGELITLDITRGKVGHTVDGKVCEDGIGMLAIEQFGET